MQTDVLRSRDDGGGSVGWSENVTVRRAAAVRQQLPGTTNSVLSLSPSRGRTTVNIHIRLSPAAATVSVSVSASPGDGRPH